MDFEENFYNHFDVKILKGELVTLELLNTNDSAEFIFEKIETCKNFLQKNLPWILNTSPEDLKRRIKSWITCQKLYEGACYKILIKDSLAGFIMLDINEKNRSALLSYWLFQNFTGQGYATDAVKIISDFAFKIGLNRLEISVATNNPKSAQVAFRAGFRLEGCAYQFEFLNGKFLDHFKFSKIAS